MKAIVSVTFDDAFVVHDIKIIEGQNGLFVAMPSRKISEGDYRDIAHPINSEMRAILQQRIFDEYKHAMLDMVQEKTVEVEAEVEAEVEVEVEEEI
jgi:stage V sporulation protein G